MYHAAEMVNETVEIDNIKEINDSIPEILQEAEVNGEINYDTYVDLLKKLNQRQIINIIANCWFRFDTSVQENTPEKRKNKAKEMIEQVPTQLRHLLGSPLIVYRFDKFISFINNYPNINEKSDKEVFWDFVLTFPQIDYYRALRVRKDQLESIDLQKRMLMAPKLGAKFTDMGQTTYPPIIGDFEEQFFYHVYGARLTKSCFVSWTEDRKVAVYAATKGADKYDPKWDEDADSTVLIVKVVGSSFFFLDETEVNKGSLHKSGREALLVMSLPHKAISEGGISFETVKKDQLQESS